LSTARLATLPLTGHELSDLIDSPDLEIPEVSDAEVRDHSAGISADDNAPWLAQGPEHVPNGSHTVAAADLPVTC
jgi:hypothetical protein